MFDLNKYDAVCKTAPTTLGLLITEDPINPKCFHPCQGENPGDTEAMGDISYYPEVE